MSIVCDMQSYYFSMTVYYKLYKLVNKMCMLKSVLENTELASTYYKVVNSAVGRHCVYYIIIYNVS